MSNSNIGQSILGFPKALYAWSLARLDNAPVYGIEHLFGPWERRLFRLWRLLMGFVVLGCIVVFALAAADVIK
jgi:hypothetical protein